jgi:hypothetical protein
MDWPGWGSPLSAVVDESFSHQSLDIGNIGYSLGVLDREEDRRSELTAVLGANEFEERVEELSLACLPVSKYYGWRR